MPAVSFVALSNSNQGGLAVTMVMFSTNQWVLFRARLFVFVWFSVETGKNLHEGEEFPVKLEEIR
ncbi:hypothetical protein CR513_20507, partial [Mucuna pruriens]